MVAESGNYPQIVPVIRQMSWLLINYLALTQCNMFDSMRNRVRLWDYLPKICSSKEPGVVHSITPRHLPMSQIKSYSTTLF